MRRRSSFGPALTDVPAGSYVVRVRTFPRMPVMSHGTPPLSELPDDPTLWGDQPVVVVDRDVDLGPGGSPYVVKSVTLAGQPLRDGMLDVAAGADVSDLLVVVRSS